MKLAVKATALILFVSLLSGCSSSTKLADRAQVKCECGLVKKIYEGFSIALKTEDNSSDSFRKIYLTRGYYLLENPKCFTSVQIAAARAEMTLATR